MICGSRPISMFRAKLSPMVSISKKFFSHNKHNTDFMSKQLQSTQKSLYYQVYVQRGNINEQMWNVIQLFLSIPVMIPEVFLKRRMGERYFSLPTVILTMFALGYLKKFYSAGYGWTGDITFIPFMIAYAIMTVVCIVEIRRAPSVFDFKRFSLDRGTSYDFFFKIKFFGKEPSQRTVNVFYEPIFCLLIGLLLILCSQFLTGMVICLCAACLFVDRSMSAIRGDHYIMDMIDQILVNQAASQNFVQNEEVSPTGVPFLMKKPNSVELREQVAAMIAPKMDEAAPVI